MESYKNVVPWCILRICGEKKIKSTIKIGDTSIRKNISAEFFLALHFQIECQYSLRYYLSFSSTTAAIQQKRT